MQQLLHKTGLKASEVTGRTVTIFLQSKFMALKGIWHWDMQAEDVFCSDVMLSLPPSLPGVKGIIHPEDIPALKDKLSEKNIGGLELRIITTWGEVKNIVGEEVHAEEVEEYFDPLQQRDAALQHIQQEREFEHLQLLKDVYERAEQVTKSGAWWYNTATNRTWYSPQVFRIYGLAPYSLNAHLNIFHPFIHPDDRDEVIESFQMAYRQKLPLHIEYRVQVSGSEKNVLQIIDWSFNAKGEEIMSGIVKDITEDRTIEQKANQEELLSQFYQQQLFFDEQHAAIGHWRVNLITRQAVFSEHFYRLFGLRPKSVPSGLNGVINYIHPEDRDAYIIAYKKMMDEQVAPDLDFRMVRADGKVRYISQKAKLVTYGQELWMMGVIADQTVPKVLEKKMAEITKAEKIRQLIRLQVEETAGAAGWIWDVKTNKITATENLYSLLQLKAGFTELTSAILVQSVHPDDQKEFQDHLSIVLQQREETRFSFRLLQRGAVRHIEAFFRIVCSEESELFMASLHDVTLEREMKCRFHQQLHLAESLSENMLDRLIITDLNNEILLWNNACVAAYRVKKSEAVGKNYFEVFPKLKTQHEVALFNRVLKGEKIVINEQKSVLSTGYINLHMLPLWNEEGEVTGIIHIIRDVSKEVNLQRHLNDRLRFIENLVDSSVDRIIAMDRNLNYVVWNKKCEEHYGLSKEEVIGKNVLELFPETQNTPAFAEFRKVLRGETVHMPATFEAGKESYEEIYLIPVKNEGDETSAILWILHDLSKEYELMKEQRRSGKIFDALNENYFELDRDYRVLYMNPKAEEFFDRKKEAILHKNIWELFPQAVDTPVYHAIIKAMEEKVVVRGEFVSPVRGTAIFSSIMPGDEGVSVIFFDIHELKATEENLQQHKDLLQAVFNASLHGIAVFKTLRAEDGEIEDFEFVLTNEISRKWNGKELVGMRYAKEFPGIRTNGIFEGFKKVVETGEPLTMEVFYGDSDKKTWYNLTAVRFGDNIVSTAENITERKRNEAELQKNLNVLTQTEELAQTGSWEYDVASGRFTWSEGMYHLFGLPAGLEVTPEIYLRFAVEGDKATAGRIVERIKDKPASFEEMMSIKKEDGSVRMLKIKASAVQNENGKTAKVIGVDVDLTELNEAVHKAREHQEMIEKTAAASPDAITVFDLINKTIVYLNDCLSAWLGFSLEKLEALGHEGRLALIHPDDRKRLQDFNKGMLSANDGEVRTVEYRIKSSAGSFIDIRNRSKVFKRDSEGGVTHTLSILQDITDEVRLKNSLSERTRYIEAIIDSSIDRMLVYDQAYTIVAWNHRSEEHTGISKEKAIGANFFDLVSISSVDEEIREAMEAALKGEYRYLPIKKGIYTSYYYERFYIPLKDASGNIYAVLNIMHDVSEAVKRNEELKELNKMLEQKNLDLEARNEEVTNFAFIASHDLREPLRKMNTFANWLLTEEEKVLTQKGKDYLLRMTDSVNRMNAMIDDILILTRINADQRNEEPINLNDVLFAVRKALKKEIDKAGAILTVDALPTVLGHRNHLLQLFKNLLDNSIKFRSPERVPEIHVTSETVAGSTINTESADPDRDYVNVCIKDNGIGIDLKYADKLFQVFQRLHGLKEYKGTGMGLAICRKVMEKHNGFITVSSQQGEGAAFCCYFPL